MTSPSSPRIQACMSMPRVAFTDNLFTAVGACTDMGIPLLRGHSVYWEQSLERLIGTAICDEFDYVLAIDYDSVFTRDQLKELIAIMEENPWLGAVCPVQMRRGSIGFALFVARDENGKFVPDAQVDERDERLGVIESGHFGLTLIRTSALKDIPKPWFMPKPDPDGGWDDGRVDADISFWFKLKEHGVPFRLATRVRIGHIQQVITWPDSVYKPYHMPMDEWDQIGERERGTQWLETCARKYHSQFGEDGIVETIFSIIGAESRWCLEVGAHDGKACSNTRHMIENGWTGILLEGNPIIYKRLVNNNARFNGQSLCRQVMIEPDPDSPRSIDSVIDAVGAPRLDFLSLDIDADEKDVEVFRRLRHRPRVVCIEHFHFTDQSDLLKKVADEKGYTEVVRTYSNTILVVDEEADALKR